MTPYYVYKVTCKTTNQYYIGSRYVHVRKNLQPEEDLFVNYFTSSNSVDKLIKEYGVDNFKKEIIYRGFDDREVYIFEQREIKKHYNEEFCLNANYYDVDAHSGEFFHVFGKPLGLKGIPKSEETKEKMRKPKSEEHKRKIAEYQKLNGGNGPSQHTEETKIKIGESSKGRVHKEETKEKIGNAHRGKHVSEETKRKIGESSRGRVAPKLLCPHCGKNGRKGDMIKYHFEFCKKLKVKKDES